MESAAKELAEGWGAGFATNFFGDPLDWMEEHVALPHSARSTKFDRLQAPWLNGPLREFANPRTKQINLRVNTGGGKTTLLELAIPYAIAVQPGGMLLVGQNDQDAKDWAESRLHPVLKGCEPVAKLYPNNRHAERTMEVLFPHMPLFIVGANLGSLQSKSMRYCIGDEVWRWKPGMIKELKARHHDRWNALTMLVTQGWSSMHEMEQEFNSGEIHVWGSACAGCGEWSPFEWGNIKFEEIELEDGTLDFQKTMDSTRHVCPRCGHETADTIANRRAMADRGEYRVESQNFIPGIKSFTWNALGVWWISWRKLVLEWLKAIEEKKKGNLEPTKAFIMKRLAQVWKEEVDLKADWQVLDDRKGTYEPGDEWEEEHTRFLTVDMQKDHFWYVCRAWAVGGASRLIEFGRFRSFDEIRDLCQRLKVPDSNVAIDSGYDAPQVYRKCLASKGAWKPFKGDQKAFFSVRGVRRPWVATQIDPMIGTSQQGRSRMFLILFSNLMTKDILSLHIRGLASPWALPSDVSAEYMKQMTAEIRREVNGRPRWEPVRNGAPNHAWDCEAMQVVCALLNKLLLHDEGTTKVSDEDE